MGVKLRSEKVSKFQQPVEIHEKLVSFVLQNISEKSKNKKDLKRIFKLLRHRDEFEASSEIILSSLFIARKTRNRCSLVFLIG